MVLQDILIARESRVKRQRELIKQYETTLISFTLNIPGPIKDKQEYRDVLDKGVSIILESMNAKHVEVNHNHTGPEAYICVEGDAHDIKKDTVYIEENYFAGRLFDIDVINKNGYTINRENLGMPLRKCLICEEAAVICARAKTHSIDDLTEKINGILKEM